ncbi:asparagine synthase-related protein [Pseudorhodoplanes sp.]|uniref:asparagine synthase-related protein n=1 Tax=Pseudorhodoplanes sp. TaxID=1934341 RepID=UPI003D134909
MMAAADAMFERGNALADARCAVNIREEYGWSCASQGAVTVWFKGRIDGIDAASLAQRFAQERPSATAVGDLLASVIGHFAICATGPGWAFAAVDWVRSIPLAAAKIDRCWVIDDRPDRLRQRAGLGAANLAPDAALAIGMAGYTIDDAALYRGMQLLVPGELAFFEDGTIRRHRYYIYRPWQVRPASSESLESELKDLTLHLIERMLGNLEGRTLVIPLSAGRDSRLIASAAKHLGYKNVRCFTYGRAGNFEARASRTIAERLGYRWTFVPATIGKQREFFASTDYERYVDFADDGCSLPFVQDMAPLMELKASGYVPDDAVIVNGNSGDFITGNHVPESMWLPGAALSDDERWQRIIDALLKKHFSLWRSLATPDNNARISALLRSSIARAGGALGDPRSDHGLYEYAEFQDRQCRYVITGQRIYEFLGHDWRLPLWDNDYLRFWEGVPLAEKIGQGLYARMLAKANWGGVWQDVPVNRKTVRPLSIIPLRLAAKALHAPFGRDRWHRFERRYFQYWLDATCNSACVPYQRVLRDTRGARHHIAWLAELYLARHGVALDHLSAQV